MTDKVNQLEIEEKDLLIFKFKTNEDGSYVYDANEWNYFLDRIKEVFPKNRCLFLPDKISLNAIIKLRKAQEETKTSFQGAADSLFGFKNSIQKTADSLFGFKDSIFNL